MDLAAIARSTLNAFEQGQYTNALGASIALGPALEACLADTRLYLPNELTALVQQESAIPGDIETAFAVVNETSLQGAERLVASGSYARVGVLNFASARHAGGGFLRGARAQEESLARSSALYLSQTRCLEFYTFHQALDTCLYTDRMIYSPACPVIRDDAGAWLPAPYNVDFITSAAPNAGAIMRNEPANRAHITPTLVERGRKVLALAAQRGCDALVLGAWGCGVFQNDSVIVARVFFDALRPDGGAFSRRFRHVLFAVRDSSRDQATFSAFERAFRDLC
jgi:uncharacterized protein (TIGR02452 family)